MSDSMRPSAKDNDEPRWTPTKELSTLMLDSDKLDAIRAIINGDFDVTPFTYNGQDVRACDPLNRLRGHFFVDDASHCQCGKTGRGAATDASGNAGDSQHPVDKGSKLRETPDTEGLPCADEASRALIRLARRVAARRCMCGDTCNPCIACEAWNAIRALGLEPNTEPEKGADQ